MMLLVGSTGKGGGGRGNGSRVEVEALRVMQSGAGLCCRDMRGLDCRRYWSWMGTTEEVLMMDIEKLRELHTPSRMVRALATLPGLPTILLAGKQWH